MVGVIVSISLVKRKEHRRIQAIDLLAQARIAQEEGRVEEAFELYKEVADDYGGTRAAGEALIALGNRFFRDGKYDEAMDAFKMYLRKYNYDDISTYAAWSGIAASLEEQGRYAEAAKQYREFADKYRHSPWAPRCLLDASRCFSLSGDETAATMALQQIIDFYPNSPVAYQAKREIKTAEGEILY